MEWKEVRLGDVCSKITDGSHFSPKAQTEGYPMLSVKDMREYDFDFSNCKKISYEDYLKMERDGCVPQIGDVLVAKDGSYLKEIFICKEQREIALLSSIAIFRPNSQLIDSRFLCYCLKSPRVYNYISLNCVSGSALPRIILKDFKGVNIRVPSLDDQRRIVSILSSLDRKIELNNKINADLEEMAQAIFKNWFVDFEPFKDGKFVDSELGMIPEGWKVGKITDIGCLITDYVSNGSFASLKQNVHLYETKEYAQFIRNTDLKTNTFSVYVDKHSYDFLSKSTLYGNEIIISNVGDVGSVHLCPKLDIPMTLGNNIIMLRPNEKEYNYFLYLWFKYFSGQGLIQGIKGGSAQPKFNKTDFKNLPLLIPSFEIIEKSYWIFESMFSILSSNVKESSRLSTLRDTLLPRLMSGELEVPE